MKIEYKSDAVLVVEEVIDLYKRSTLGERRPVDRPDIFAQMLEHSNLIITAWSDGALVGIARSLTDFAYVAYLADLAVDSRCQRQGIGKALIAETQARLWPECKIVLLAAPAANSYYSGLGFEHNPRAWIGRVADNESPQKPTPDSQPQDELTAENNIQPPARRIAQLRTLADP